MDNILYIWENLCMPPYIKRSLLQFVIVFVFSLFVPVEDKWACVASFLGIYILMTAEQIIDKLDNK